MKRPSLIAAVLSFFLVLAGMDATAGEFSGNALEEQDDTLRPRLEGMSAIYRAKLAKQYPMRYNGTPYWDTCGFKKGTVIFNGRLYEDMLVNLDAAQGEEAIGSEPDQDTGEKGFPVHKRRSSVTSQMYDFPHKKHYLRRQKTFR